MENGKKCQKPHCLILPYPAQGHINPMLQFAKRLQHKGIKVTLANTHFISKTIHGNTGITVESISDGYDEGGFRQAESINAYLTRFQLVGSQTLAHLLGKLHGLGCPVDCLVYDAFMPWALDVAKRVEIVGAVFFTQSCAMGNIFYHTHGGLLSLPLTGTEVSLPAMPILQNSDMPTFIYHHFGAYPAYFDMVVNQFSNIDEADWIFYNTFYELEEEVTDWMTKRWPLKTIGPTISSMYLDQQIEDDIGYGLDLYKPNTGACIKWLNNRRNGSVVYVSFGSMATLEVTQMEEIAWGLKNSNTHFLWVVREAQEQKLPKDFKEITTSEKGLVVSWCSQLEVLAHDAVGCFVTHCGWNSTLEGMSLGVPIVAMPHWADQPVNAKLVEDFWKAGVKARADKMGIVRRDTIEKCIREVMEGERGEEIKINCIKLKKMAKEAIERGGSSDRNIDEFVNKLVHK